MTPTNKYVKIFYIRRYIAVHFSTFERNRPKIQCTNHEEPIHIAG
jgi:hypothetical protein